MIEAEDNADNLESSVVVPLEEAGAQEGRRRVHENPRRR